MRFALPTKLKPVLNALKTAQRDAERGWPGYLFGGRVRTSTVALVLVFLGVWWVHDRYQPAPNPPAQVPATQVVPPGFVPDPNYTWVPRSRLQQPPATVTVTKTPSETPTTTTSESPLTTTASPTTSTPAPPPFQLPVLPPPFGPPPPTTTPPAPSPAPTSPPPPG